MEKRIEEKYSGLWRVVWCYAAIPIGLALLAPFGSWIVGNGFADPLLPSAVVVASVLFMIGFVRLLSGRQKPTWFLTDDGLQQIDTSGERNMITWEQIQDMRWAGFIGLVIRWNKPQLDRKNKTFYENVRSGLSVEEQEAKDLISIWREKKATTSKSHEAYKIRDRNAPLRGGKLILAGCVGLIGVISAILKTMWLIAVVFGLFSATAFGLGIWTFYPSASKIKSSAMWFILSLLVVFGVCICLLEKNMGLSKK